MTRAQIERTLSEVVDARRKGDTDAVAKHFAPNATYRMSGTPDLGPMTAAYCGPANIMATVSYLIQTWDFTDFPAVSIHVDGDTAYVYNKGVLRHVPTNTRPNIEILARGAFRDGFITEVVALRASLKVHLVNLRREQILCRRRTRSFFDGIQLRISLISQPERTVQSADNVTQATLTKNKK